MLNKEFLDNLTPIEVELVHQYINLLFKDKVTTETTNYENLETSVTECPHCHGHKFVKNGHDQVTGRQRYICRNKECGRPFSVTTGTLFSHSRQSYNTWLTFIGCEVVGLTLREETDIVGISKTGCFNMRHKLHEAIRDYQDSQKLKGTCEVDATYTSINLKGWKKDMPRISKKRGKHKPDPDHPKLRGISHHKVCMVTSIDENDHILFKIAGLGPETSEMYNSYSSYFGDKCMIVCDGKACIEDFAKENGFTTDIIPSGAFKSDQGNTLATLNQVHQEFSEMIRKRHGVGTRHLQGYIDWLVMTKQLRYKIESRKLKAEIYMQVMRKGTYWTTDDICHKPLPIDVNMAYYEYNQNGENLHQLIS
jgi:transposase-like protein